MEVKAAEGDAWPGLDLTEEERAKARSQYPSRKEHGRRLGLFVEVDAVCVSSRKVIPERMCLLWLQALLHPGWWVLVHDCLTQRKPFGWYPSRRMSLDRDADQCRCDFARQGRLEVEEGVVREEDMFYGAGSWSYEIQQPDGFSTTP